jgi:hypothetical protein
MYVIVGVKGLIFKEGWRPRRVILSFARGF